MSKTLIPFLFRANLVIIYSMTLLQDSILLMAMINITFASVLYLHSKKPIQELFFIFSALNVGFWSFSVFLLTLAEVNLSYFKIGVIGHFWTGNFIFLSFFWFVLFYKNEMPRSRFFWPALVTIGDIFLLLLMAFSDFTFKSIKLAGSLNEAIIINKFGYNIYSFYLLCVFLVIELILLKKYFAARGTEHKQIGYIILGTFIAGLLGLSTNLFLPGIGIFSAFLSGPILSTIFVAMISYAILKHDLFNLKIIATEIFTIVLIIAVAINLFGAKTLDERLMSGFTLILALFFGLFIIRSVYREVQAKEKIANLASSLEAANTELKRLDRAKSEFISIASHQLRTPLTIIKGYLSMIREGNYGAVTPEVSTTVNKMYLSNERLIKLVNDLLDLSRMESGRMKYEFLEMDLEEVIDSAVDEFQLPAKDKHIKIVWKKDGRGLPKIWGDAWKLRQVVFNLIDNALKYNRDGDIEIKLEKEDDSLKLSVKDSGIGMTEETINNIFHKFSRGRESAVAKVNAVGVGLGLYIAKRIVDDHGGNIWVESPGEGKGSVFYVRLPLASKHNIDSQLKEFTTNE